MPSEQPKPVERLVERILSAKQRDAGADASALERDLDDLVDALYGLTPAERDLVKEIAKKYAPGFVPHRAISLNRFALPTAGLSWPDLETIALLNHPERITRLFILFSARNRATVALIKF